MRRARVCNERGHAQARRAHDLKCKLYYFFCLLQIFVSGVLCVPLMRKRSDVPRQAAAAGLYGEERSAAHNQLRVRHHDRVRGGGRRRSAAAETPAVGSEEENDWIS